MSASALYAGQVVHQRFAPKRHRLQYPVFQMVFDLDELPELGRGLRLFGHNRPAPISFYDRDHGVGAAGPLRDYVESALADAGLSLNGGRILLLCMPRVFGHVFNPLSVYYCFDGAGDLAAVLYEVNNTFGERHSYLIPAGVPSAGGVIEQSCDKAFFVSPFMNMNMRYGFRISLPGERITTIINATDDQGAPLIFASFVGERREMTDRVLLGALLRYPFLTLGVVAAIHWEALLIFAKGIGLKRRPPPPPEPVTLVA